MVGETTSMRALGASIAKVAPSEVTVLLRARAEPARSSSPTALHELSTRADNRFVQA
jgi:transcriptional regulator with GAF, ATPase, and Fis domain